MPVLICGSALVDCAHVTNWQLYCAHLTNVLSCIGLTTPHQSAQPTYYIEIVRSAQPKLCRHPQKSKFFAQNERCTWHMWTSTRALVDGARSAQPTKCNKKSNSLYRNNRHMTSLPLNFGHLLVLCASLLWTCDEPTLIVWPFQPLRIDCSTNKMQQDHVQKLCQHKQSLNSLCWSCWQVCAPILCESCKRGMRILRLVHMGSQAPSPTHVSKSQHEGTISTLSLKTVLQYGWLSSKSDLDYSMQEDNWKTCVQSLIEQKDFASKKCCHVGVQVILETKVWSDKSQFPCS